MPRKPAQVELVGGKGPRQRVWDLIRAKHGAPFVVAEVTPGDVPLATVRTYLQCLLAGNVIGLAADPAPFSVCEWRLVKDAGAEAPRLRKDGSPVTQGLAQEQMWRTLRMLKGDTNARELAAHASTPAVAVRQTAANDYLGNLLRAGYLRLTRAGKGIGQGGIQARYQLVSNTGPRPPMVCRADAVYDPNLGKTVWVRPVTEEDAIYGN